ncbi:hypothetical protein B0I31_102724 [Saccharothrix carnea]|uniref:Uncharacterized protein n=1 Tax=Saccharothrix carnea TaxID=1280637 RepID=A0A2P8IH01_SACCR|nr:hypothetical protein [Saccharothrix carnea]PSL57745.1 hypothetical protein B0I31_102724 [Saccharothrix carnea]
MRWLTGGSFAIVACAVVVGCGEVPGDPGPAGRVRSAESASPGHSTAETTAETPSGTAQESPEPETGPTTPAPRIPSPRVPPTTAKRPGVPGSPIDYNATYVGQPLDLAKGFLEAELKRVCANDPGEMCGITIKTVSPRPGDNCFVGAGPDPVPRGGTITIEGGPCADGTGESVSAPVKPSESTPETSRSGR